MNISAPIITAALSQALGPDRACTIAALCEQCACGRREMEQFLEDNLEKFPFVVVAGGRGYYRPVEAQQINSYLRNLHSRHRRMQIREATVRRRARLDGWSEQPTGFFEAEAKQLELIPQ